MLLRFLRRHKLEPLIREKNDSPHQRGMSHACYSHEHQRLVVTNGKSAVFVPAYDALLGSRVGAAEEEEGAETLIPKRQIQAARSAKTKGDHLRVEAQGLRNPTYTWGPLDGVNGVKYEIKFPDTSSLDRAAQKTTHGIRLDAKLLRDTLNALSPGKDDMLDIRFNFESQTCEHDNVTYCNSVMSIHVLEKDNPKRTKRWFAMVMPIVSPS